MMTPHEIMLDLIDLGKKHSDPSMIVSYNLTSLHQYSPLYNLTRHYVKPQAKVLDWGCGEGHFSFFLLKSGYDTTGYSLFPCPFINELNPLGFKFIKGDLSDPVSLPFSDGSFDAVFSIGVLEHVRETNGTEDNSLKELARVLKPGGIFLCYHFPNKFSWVDSIARFIPNKHHHRFRYTKSDVKNLFERNGFKILETTRYAILPRNIIKYLPKKWERSEKLALFWDRLDFLLGKILSIIATNHRIVAVKI